MMIHVLALTEPMQLSPMAVDGESIFSVSPE